MTTTYDTIKATPPTFVAQHSHGGPRRGAAAIIVGTVLAGSGLLTAVFGGVLLSMVGDGRTISSDTLTISTSTSAVVSDIGQINNLWDGEFLTGSPTLHISAQAVDDSGVFVGVGPTDDVEHYLDSVATERVTDMDHSLFDPRTRMENGQGTAQVPGVESFWVASAESFDEAQLDWALEDGSFEIVVMNADGSAGIITSLEIAAGIAHSTGLWILVTAIGVLILLGGGAAILVGFRQRRTSGRF